MNRPALSYLAAGAALALVAAECALRWGIGLGDPPLARLDRATEYELVPSATYRRWGNTISINANGMRAPDHPETPASEERHLLLIGDSVVYGGHFLDQTETISAQLRRAFEADPDLDGCVIRVLPMAVSSWGPINQAAFLAERGTFGSSVAGIVVSAHDLYDVPQTASDILPYRQTPSWSAIGDAVQAVIERRQQAAYAGADLAPLEERERQSLEALDRMAMMLRDQGVHPFLIYHPTQQERGGTVKPAKARFAQWSRSQDISLIDLGDVRMQVGDYRDDIHPAAPGAGRIARHLAPVLATALQPCNDS
ncbi:hypothetical protein [Sulfitobacter mediterraneus]|uniref:hypothetical protein n=1 Tax=Sulfitobacter mediterraneus TaxID=83219 RepID=UPI000EA3E676|nr:hypothetical protein [Sulfitobacter mediterraneus]